MGLKIEIVSKEIIKPSNPTPNHLRNFNLSFIDQLIVHFYIPIALFYNSPNSSQFPTVSLNLKKSLSETLTRFYPLAGKMKGNHSIQCNDDGVIYSESRANITLSDFLKNPQMDEIRQLLPFNPNELKSGDEVELAGVQVNVFSCGGISIGLCISHHVADGASVSSFLTSWASTAKNSGAGALSPVLDSASVLFPTRDFTMKFPDELQNFVPGKVEAKKFEFTAKNLSLLRSKLSNGINPSRVEAVTALLWKSALKGKIGKDSIFPASMAVHAVNLRPRMVPPLPEVTFGNLWQLSNAKMMKRVKEVELDELVSILRASVKKIDGKYCDDLKKENGFEMAMENSEVLYRKNWEMEVFFFSSWVRFGFYENDFGWGNPIWMCTTSVPMNNLFILMGTRSGDGITAWVNLPENEMIEFEKDEELLTFVSYKI